MTQKDQQIQLPAPPELGPGGCWSGTLEECISTFVEPWWPEPSRIAAWTEAAIAWHERSDALLLVRGSADKGWLHLENGNRLVYTDNSPGIWILLRARDGLADPALLPSLVEEGVLPVLKIRARGDPERPWNHSTTALSTKDASALWTRGMKHCHVFGLRPAAGVTQKQRSLRNIGLINHFIFPNGVKHFHTERDGWKEARNTTDLGESATMCGLAFHESVKRVRSVAPGLAERFLSAAGATIPKIPSSTRALRVRIRRREPRRGTELRERKTPAASPDSESVISVHAHVRKWKLRRDNHAHHHGVVDLSESPLYLDLSWRPNASTCAASVGVFRLDLHELLRGGFIRNDPAGSRGTRLRLRVVLDDDGCFYVQTKRGMPRFLLSEAEEG